MNDAQRQLLARLREIVVETPKSGALNAGGKPLRLSRFSPAIEARAGDGSALVEYVRSKVYGQPTEGYDALVRAGRPDLTAEAVVADADAPWATEFTDLDRSAAAARLGLMLDEQRERDEAKEAEAVAHDRKLLANVNARRVAKGQPVMTPEQEQARLDELAASRRAAAQK